MNTAIRPSFPRRQQGVHLGPEIPALYPSEVAAAAMLPEGRAEAVKSKVRVSVVLENRFLHNAIASMLGGRSDIEVLGAAPMEVFCAETLTEPWPDVLLLAPKGNLNEDVSLIRAIRNNAPSVRIVIFGGLGEELEFLQYVRAGIRAYLPADASKENVLEALLAVCAGKASCPGSLCATLFGYLEREATSLPSAGARQRLGLTRREQQLIPLIAKGFTNKEIANHFCLSEQTIKNHLYRMKHKVGAGNRLGIVQTCHTQGFLL